MASTSSPLTAIAPRASRRQRSTGVARSPRRLFTIVTRSPEINTRWARQPFVSVPDHRRPGPAIPITDGVGRLTSAMEAANWVVETASLSGCNQTHLSLGGFIRPGHNADRQRLSPGTGSSPVSSMSISSRPSASTPTWRACSSRKSGALLRADPDFDRYPSD
jgi:hypothetical protein